MFGNTNKFILRHESLHCLWLLKLMGPLIPKILQLWALRPPWTDSASTLCLQF